MPEPTCPTPAKSRFATETAAEIAASRYGKTLRPYECPCGWYHLTSKPAPPEPIEDPTVTQYVAALDDEEFHILVGTDIRGQATPQQAAALRHRINLDRWIDSLAAIKADLGQQIAAHVGDLSPETQKWRQRLRRVQQSLSDRRTEAQKIRRELNAAKGRERERLQVEGTTRPQARAEVGQRAIDRLIESHRSEFGQLLAEEFEKAGLEVPVRVARHIARNTALATSERP